MIRSHSSIVAVDAHLGIVAAHVAEDLVPDRRAVDGIAVGQAAIDPQAVIAGVHPSVLVEIAQEHDLRLQRSHDPIAHAVPVLAQVDLVPPGGGPVCLRKQRIVGVQERADRLRLVDRTVDQRHRLGLVGRVADGAVGVAQPHLSHRFEVGLGREHAKEAERRVLADQQGAVHPLQAGERRPIILDVLHPQRERGAGKRERQLERDLLLRDRDAVAAAVGDFTRHDLQIAHAELGTVHPQRTVTAAAEDAARGKVAISAHQWQVRIQRHLQLPALEDHRRVVPVILHDV